MHQARKGLGHWTPGSAPKQSHALVHRQDLRIMQTCPIHADATLGRQDRVLGVEGSEGTPFFPSFWTVVKSPCQPGTGKDRPCSRSLRPSEETHLSCWDQGSPDTVPTWGPGQVL